ncbi:DNA ligase 1 [Stomoxys calcitrans]|uniref:DNA ligase n=1 Tax=Stomoxys calcitrans TaxID=35570 RepID=A0A1I8PAX1_STOCA|nr:DNA ligase 1 [Stomoxys calcitrans]
MWYCQLQHFQNTAQAMVNANVVATLFRFANYRIPPFHWHLCTLQLPLSVSRMNFALRQLSRAVRSYSANKHQLSLLTASSRVFLDANKNKTQTSSDEVKKKEEANKKEGAAVVENGTPASDGVSSATKRKSEDASNSPVGQAAKVAKKEVKDEKSPKTKPKKEKSPKSKQQTEKPKDNEENEKSLGNKEKKEESIPKTEDKEETVVVKKEEVVKPETSGSSPKQPVRTMCLQLNDTKVDTIITDYNPDKNNYHPLKDAAWKKGEKIPYLALARTFQLIEETRGRLKMVEILGNFFSSVLVTNPDDLLPSIYLSINQLAPAYEGLELGVAETTLMKIICDTTGRKMDFIKSQTHITGDLGIVAEQSRMAQRMMFKPAPLTIAGVFKKLKDIANAPGKNKITPIKDIFIACRGSEARFFIRSLIGKLRIGIAEQSLINAVATSLVKVKYLDNFRKMSDEKIKSKIDEVTLILKTTYCQCPNYDKIIPTLLEHGIDEIEERCPMLPGVPIKPMLAQPTKGVSEVLERFDGLTITCEFKYDGERAQIHCDENGVISIFSRNQENNTTKYPDIICRIGEFAKSNVKSYIIDSEIVAWDVEQQMILPFQVLTTRKRKNVDVQEIKVQVCVYAFDLLYLNGEPLVTKAFADRRNLMKENFNETEGMWHFAHAMDTSDVDEVQQFLEESIKGNCEGLMVKTLQKDATYEIARRSRNWLKLKKDYLAGCGDSLDLVVIGGYRGKGKRTGSYGGFLLACYDDENEEYQSICKIGTGFSDEDLQTHAEFFKNHVVPNKKSYIACDSSLEPDDWFEPVQVWEVKCADLSISPIHKAAIGIADPEKGISLRFPRFIRIRDDKTAEMATTGREVAYMYNSQDQIKNQQSRQTAMDDDFY